MAALDDFVNSNMPAALGSAPSASAPPIAGGQEWRAPMQLPPEQAPSQGAGMDNIDPEASRSTFMESMSAAKTAPDEELKKMTTVLDDMFGPGRYVEAYNELYEKLGGKKALGPDQPKLTDREKAMAVFDFGLRMMAHSAAGEPLGGAIAKSGLETRAATEALKERNYKRFQYDNAIAREGALGMQQEMGKDRRAALGAMTDIEYANSRRSYANRPTEKQWLYETAMRIYKDRPNAEELSLNIATGGWPPQRARQEASEMLLAQEKRGTVYMPDGSTKKANELTAADRERFIEYAVDLMTSPPGGGPGLRQERQQQQGAIGGGEAAPTRRPLSEIGM